MAIFGLRRVVLAFVLTSPVLVLSACEPVSGNAGGSVYYDSMLWNDYYYGRPGSRPPKPPGPGKPVHPIEPPRPNPPIARPPVPRPPVARPPIARPPIHRPSPARF
jgi:hypothetical protein